MNKCDSFINSQGQSGIIVSLFCTGSQVTDNEIIMLITLLLLVMNVCNSDGATYEPVRLRHKSLATASTYDNIKRTSALLLIYGRKLQHHLTVQLKSTTTAQG